MNPKTSIIEVHKSVKEKTEGKQELIYNRIKN